MPTYSNDGQWWWDGRAWQPVTTQPPQQYQQHGGQWQQPPPRKSRKTLLIVGIAALVILIPGGVVAGRHFATGKGDASGAVPPPAGKNLEPGQPVTEQSLGEVGAKVFYESVLKRQMTQPLGQLKTAYFASEETFTSRRESWAIRQVAIDHKTDKYAHERSIMEGSADPNPANMKCLDGKEMLWRNYLQAWEPDKYGGSKCRPDRKPQGGSDGIVSSGLSPEQADKVLSELRGTAGHVTPGQPTLLKTNGKTYVRQVVDFKPITQADNNYYGTALPMWAFRAAGLDPATWPWSNPFSLTAGVHAVYYLDPATLLPVAAFQRETDTPAQNGKPARKRESIQLVNYSYPKALPVPVLGKNRGTLTLDLPEGWKVQ